MFAVILICFALHTFVMQFFFTIQSHYKGDFVEYGSTDGQDYDGESK